MKIALVGLLDREFSYFEKNLEGCEIVKIERKLDLDVASEIADCEMISLKVNSMVTEQILEKLPQLKYVVTQSTGFDHIDLEACKKRAITVCNVPSYGETSVAEFVLGMIFSLAKNMHLANERTKKMQFESADLDGIDVMGKMLGVVGTGTIGREVARLGKRIGMQVLAYDIYENRNFSQEIGFSYVDLETLLEKSDFVSLHVPYAEKTHHFFDREKFSKMKKGSFFINTARGAVVGTDDLIWALDHGIIAGAGLDVLEKEKLLFSEIETDEALKEKYLKLRTHNVILTPHMAAHSVEAQQKKYAIILENIRNCISGNPVNIVK